MAIGISVDKETPIEGLHLRNLVSWKIPQDKIVVKSNAVKRSGVLSSVGAPC